ncbi:MAG: hypothetical protein ACR2P3_09235 [Geminicoccaceae bacterium]
MGDSLDAILIECDAGDLELPSEITNHFMAKEPWMDVYLDAYSDLSTCRSHGGYVPWTAVDRYAERFEMDDDFAIWFYRAIRSIDDAYVKVGKEEQAKADRKT